MKDVQRWLKQQHLHTSSARSYLLPRDPVLMPTVLNQTRALAVQLNFLDADVISWQLTKQNENKNEAESVSTGWLLAHYTLLQMTDGCWRITLAFLVSAVEAEATPWQPELTVRTKGSQGLAGMKQAVDSHTRFLLRALDLSFPYPH